MDCQISNKKISILLLIFRRKDTTLKVLESIRNYKPERIYIASDGSRKEQVIIQLNFSNELNDTMKYGKPVVFLAGYFFELYSLFHKKLATSNIC
jgi:GT2 family glycosyltransferase